MEKVSFTELELTQDERYITLDILETITLSTLKKRVSTYLCEKEINLLENLILEDAFLRGRQTIIIDRKNNILEQFSKKYFTYFYLGNKEVLINEFDQTYYYLEDGQFFDAKEINEDDKKMVVESIRNIFNYLKQIHNDSRYNAMIDYLYIKMQIVNYDRVFKVIEDDVLTLVIPNFYKISAEWMKMNIILKQTGEIIGILEFNFKNEKSDFYDYLGNVSYEIKPGYQRCGYATRALNLLRKYLRMVDTQDKTLYISTDVNNISSQKVALNNEGVLCYEGRVPNSSIVSFLNKIDQVKIYRIENV